MTSSRPKPYVVRILRDNNDGNLNEVLTSEKTHERFSVCDVYDKLILVKRA